MAQRDDLNEFDLGRLFERREVRDQLIVLAKIHDDNQLREILWAWLLDTMDHLPEGRYLVEIEDTYVVFE